MISITYNYRNNHPYRPSCSCGWQSCAYVTREAAETMARDHGSATGHGQEAAAVFIRAGLVVCECCALVIANDDTSACRDWFGHGESDHPYREGGGWAVDSFDRYGQGTGRCDYCDGTPTPQDWGYWDGYSATQTIES